MTAMEQDRAADYLARFLRARGMSPTARIGVETADSYEMSVAMLAVHKTGATCVLIDLTEPEPERREWARQVGVDLVLTHDDALYESPAVPAELFATMWREAESV